MGGTHRAALASRRDAGGSTPTYQTTRESATYVTFESKAGNYRAQNARQTWCGCIIHRECRGNCRCYVIGVTPPKNGPARSTESAAPARIRVVAPCSRGCETRSMAVHRRSPGAVVDCCSDIDNRP